jgi:hypothetical protein
LVLPYAFLGLLTLLFLTGAAYAWDYTNSPPFCGETCHTMPPEYTAYLTSPHARVDCVDCHIGKGFIAQRITRKAGDLKHVFATTFQTYEFPIRAGELRPARETCELCHSPEKFSDDSLREIKRFEDDRDNSPYSIFLVLKTGGGSEREGLGRGIHWHIENKVFYFASDESEQTIPYVRVVEDDGSITEYVELGTEIDPQTINSDQLEEMDCITCHNRITHQVPYPRDTVDEMMARGLISPLIPDIHAKAIEVYSADYPSVAMGLKGIAGLESYYNAYYADYYAENEERVQSAIRALQQAYRDSVYPEQKSDWTSHPDNVGHQNTPGCFRCHDGKHISAKNEAIRLECNLCHSIPIVAQTGDFVANIEVSRGREPSSHLNTNWISMHRQVFDQSCSNCHTTGNPGGTDNSSFCSNSACHGLSFEYAGFDAPGLREIITSQLPPTPTPMPLPSGDQANFETAIGPIFEARCGNCHGPTNSTLGLNLSEYDTTMQGSDNGAVILPGDAENSPLVQVQTAEQPHFGQLTPEEVDLVIDWINRGAPQQ